MDICTLHFNVTLPDVGENNELSNKGILKIMQEAACIHSDYSGISVNSSKENGIAWVVLTWKLKVFSRPCWNTSLTVNTWTSKISPLFFYRDFEIFDDRNNLIAVATSKWILYNLNTKSIVRVTNEIKNIFDVVPKFVFSLPFDDRLVASPDYISEANYTVLKRDIDTNHHVNNLNYIDFASEVTATDFDNMEIEYKHESKLGNSLKILFSQQDGKNFVTIKNNDENKISCIIKLY